MNVVLNAMAILALGAWSGRAFSTSRSACRHRLGTRTPRDVTNGLKMADSGESVEGGPILNKWSR